MEAPPLVIVILLLSFYYKYITNTLYVSLSFFIILLYSRLSFGRHSKFSVSVYYKYNKTILQVMAFISRLSFGRKIQAPSLVIVHFHFLSITKIVQKHCHSCRSFHAIVRSYTYRLHPPSLHISSFFFDYKYITNVLLLSLHFCLSLFCGIHTNQSLVNIQYPSLVIVHFPFSFDYNYITNTLPFMAFISRRSFSR